MRTGGGEWGGEWMLGVGVGMGWGGGNDKTDKINISFLNSLRPSDAYMRR